MTNDDRYTEFVKNMQDDDKVESYGRLSLYWFASNIPDEVIPDENLYCDLIGMSIERVYPIAASVGEVIADNIINARRALVDVKHTKERDIYLANLDIAMRRAAAIRKYALSQNWTLNFNDTCVNGISSIPPIIARYVARLSGVDNTNLIREYDVRVLLQLSCEEMWKVSSIQTLIANHHVVEAKFLISICMEMDNNPETTNISLNTLKQEAEMYVRDHMHIEPTHTEEAFNELKNTIHSSATPKHKNNFILN